ncbi:MAG: ATP-dependent DNA helicase RecQ, partial [bacterium]|nr:ATP-dependent DNA helicase RecQ [bacterium]
EALEKALRAWRLGEAKRKRVPAFRILTDRTLRAIAATKPHSSGELLELPGIGKRIAENYGDQILRIVQQAG